MAVLESSTLSTSDGTVIISVEWNEATKSILSLHVNNETGALPGQRRRQVHAKILVDGLVNAEYAGQSDFVVKAVTNIQAVAVVVGDETYYELPANVTYEYAVL